MDSWYWRFLENYVYRQPESPLWVRTKPLEVICVGPPRSATESLQHALLRLGYDYTCHGWDLMFEEPHHMQGWVRLGRKKWFGARDGDCHLSAAEIDELLGHCVAVTDVASSCFAAEMIEAYPDARWSLKRDGILTSGTTAQSPTSSGWRGTGQSIAGAGSVKIFSGHGTPMRGFCGLGCSVDRDGHWVQASPSMASGYIENIAT